MCEFYSVGPDELNISDEEIENASIFKWQVYHYTSEPYEGHGDIVAYDPKDNMLYYSGLNHCSCYGPEIITGYPATRVNILGDVVSANDVFQITIEEFFRDKEDIHEQDFCKEIKDKVRELLSK